MLGILKRESCITYGVISAIALVISSIYVFFTTIFCLNIRDKDKSDTITEHMYWLNVIGLSILTICPTVVGIVMMHKLRNRFDDIYSDYGCKI